MLIQNLALIAILGCACIGKLSFEHIPLQTGNQLKRLTALMSLFLFKSADSSSAIKRIGWSFR